MNGVLSEAFHQFPFSTGCPSAKSIVEERMELSRQTRVHRQYRTMFLLNSASHVQRTAQLVLSLVLVRTMLEHHFILHCLSFLV
jgi:hypothetical protein